ncbi:MAG: hypothetical protein ACTSRW_16070 [Candidatus Helarchaeota archaeon]
MVLSEDFAGFNIKTECSNSIEDDILTIKSPKEKINFAYRCDFTLETKLQPKTNKIFISLEILMKFDPDGSNLEVFINEKPVCKTDFIALLGKEIHHGEWGDVKLTLNVEPREEASVLKLTFRTFHGDDPFDLRIKNLQLKEEK